MVLKVDSVVCINALIDLPKPVDEYTTPGEENIHWMNYIPTNLFQEITYDQRAFRSGYCPGGKQTAHT